MASVSLHAPLSVLIKGKQLVVTQAVEGVRRTLCILYLDDEASFFMRDGKLIYRYRFEQEFPFDMLKSEEAHDLLSQLADAQLQRTPDELAKIHSRHADEVAELKSRQIDQTGRLPAPMLAFAAAATVLLGFWLGVWFGPEKQSVASASAPNQTLNAPQLPAADASPLPVLSAPSAVPDDEWPLSPAIRATLPEKLHHAAARKLFTVDYSSGHARTLYVFADPGCPNCKRLEPALNALSDSFNVVVFPVPVIGKQTSVAAITPVLCLPPEQRKAAWDALFDPAPDGLKLGQAQQQASGDCEVADKALGINQVAYQAYRIPGTPWVISDDGRYVSQALLRDPLTLQAFLNEQPAPKVREVSDAR